jgi:hypothetical protein
VGLAHTRFLGGRGLARGRFSLCFHAHKNTHGYRQVYGVFGVIKKYFLSYSHKFKKIFLLRIDCNKKVGH